MTPRSKLELTWVGKENRPRLEPRILEEMPEHSHGDPGSGNMLIHGDNLLALKALEQDFAGKVKCIFIDPPYNTGSAFTHYDDGLEHSLWLTMMRDRLDNLWRLLSDDGSIWISIDDHEAHYLKVLCDEAFGRVQYKTTIAWQKKYSVSNNFKGIATICDFVIVYAKTNFRNNLLPRTEESRARYANPDNDPRGPWKAVDYLNQVAAAARPNLCYDITNPFTGEIVKNRVKAWKFDPAAHAIQVAENRLWWGKDGKNSVPALKLFLSDVREGMTPHNWWPHEEVGHTDEARKESIGIFGPADAFDTPKPERLIKRILEIGSSEGDLVLDSFAGSGTTGAVAQKMGRRWIMVELGDHCYTHILPRMNKVTDGADPGGITEAVGWQGGGGFKFYRLAEALLVKDTDLSTSRRPVWVINPRYDSKMLVRAICKIEDFRYSPDDRWNGASSEHHFLHVTTKLVNQKYIDWLADQLAPEEALLVYCTRRLSDLKVPDQIEIKKIPKDLLGKCEFEEDKR